MFEGLRHLFSNRPLTDILRDFLDVFIVAYVIYRALLVLRGTRAIQMGIGLGIVFLVYVAARFFELVTLVNLLSSLLSSIILIVVVVFQNDIRRALIRMGGKAWFSGGREQQSRVIEEVVAAATELARHRMGAIIAFEQDANVLEFVKSEGIPLDSVVTRELLVSLFVPESVNKLHDGAILIRDLKIARAGVFFPMPETKILDSALGSRHRAALGITEETDAVVVVVSEERGTISFCFSGNIVSNLDAQSLQHALSGLFGRSSRKKRFAKKVASGVRPSTLPTATPRPQMSEGGGRGSGQVGGQVGGQPGGSETSTPRTPLDLKGEAARAAQAGAPTSDRTPDSGRPSTPSKFVSTPMRASQVAEPPPRAGEGEAASRATFVPTSPSGAGGAAAAGSRDESNPTPGDDS